MNLFTLNGKHALIVGGAGDIGRSMTEALAEAGVEKLVIIDVVEPSQEWLRGISCQTYFINVDIADQSAILKGFEEALAKLDHVINILVNAAGIQRRYPADEFPIQQWEEVIDVNLTAVFLFTKLAAGSMKKSGGGKIINVGSINGNFGGSNIVAYTAAKAGVAQLSKAFCNDVGQYGININTIAPGYIETQLNTNLYSNSIRMEEISRRIPQGRWGVPEDLKGITIFLAAPASDYVNGATICVDGGYSWR